MMDRRHTSATESNYGAFQLLNKRKQSLYNELDSVETKHEKIKFEKNLILKIDESLDGFKFKKEIIEKRKKSVTINTEAAVWHPGVSIATRGGEEEQRGEGGFKEKFCNLNENQKVTLSERMKKMDVGKIKAISKTSKLRKYSDGYYWTGEKTLKRGGKGKEAGDEEQENEKENIEDDLEKEYEEEEEEKEGEDTDYYINQKSVTKHKKIGVSCFYGDSSEGKDVIESIVTMDWGLGYVEISAKEDEDISTSIFKALLSQVDVRLQEMQCVPMVTSHSRFTRLFLFKSRQNFSEDSKTSFRRNSCKVS